MDWLPFHYFGLPLRTAASSMKPMREITELLKAWNHGDKQAMDRLLPLVDQELKRIAHNYMRNERSEHILQTTALVNEALIRLIRENIDYENRGQFYGFVARRMHQVLVDYANKELAAKRGKRPDQGDLLEVEEQASEKSKEVLMLEEALIKLAKIDERKAKIVECRFFIGLSIPEIADHLGVGHATVEREWSFTRSWLQREMTGEEPASE